VTFGEVSNFLILVTQEFDRMVPYGICLARSSNNIFRSAHNNFMWPVGTIYELPSLNHVKYGTHFILTWDQTAYLQTIIPKMERNSVTKMFFQYLHSYNFLRVRVVIMWKFLYPPSQLEKSKLAKHLPYWLNKPSLQKQ
jgi:hypothetical protein